MEKMYDTARDHEDPDVDLKCPQCRSSIANMQYDARLACLRAKLPRCSQEAAETLVKYEDLLTETLHLSGCDTNGHPFFTLPPAVASRIMSRDAVCAVVRARQGAAAAAQLSRQLRSEDYAGAMELLVGGYAAALADTHATVPEHLQLLTTMAERQFHGLIGGLEKAHRASKPGGLVVTIRDENGEPVTPDPNWLVSIFEPFGRLTGATTGPGLARACPEATSGEVVFARVADAKRCQMAMDGMIEGDTYAVKLTKGVLKAKIEARSARFEEVAGGIRNGLKAISSRAISARAGIRKAVPSRGARSRSTRRR